MWLENIDDHPARDGQELPRSREPVYALEIAARQTVEKDLGIQPNVVEKRCSSVNGPAVRRWHLLTDEDTEPGATGRG